MTIDVLMPALSPTMTEGTLAKWHVKEGDEITAGDVIAEIETDKATMEVEAVDEGILGKILVPDGSENVAVNTLIAVILEDGEDASAAEGAGSGSAPAPAPAPEAEKPAAASVPKEAPAAPAPQASDPADKGDRVFASPLAKRIAKDNGLDLAKVSGSGPHGRVVKADVEAAMKAGTGKAEAAAPTAEAPAKSAAPASGGAAPAAAVLSQDDPIFKMLPEAEAIPHTNMRKTIARRLTESARDVPHFNVQADVAIDNLMAMRKQLNERDGADYKISVNDFIIKASALALKRVPDANVAFTEQAILKFDRVDTAVAVAIDGGLITPIIKDCASKGLATISAEMKDLAGRARDGKLKPEEYQGGTFSISNLGMFGVKSFNSIINSPQGGILSVGAGEARPVVKDGAVAIATMLSLSLAVDHRCIDGAVAAGFMKELKTLIEDPIALML